MEFMYQHKARADMRANRAQTLQERSRAGRPSIGTPARIVAPTPATGARWAKPGERPPSKYAPGENDDVIERYDAWAAQFHAGKVKRG